MLDYTIRPPLRPKETLINQCFLSPSGGCAEPQSGIFPASPGAARAGKRFNQRFPNIQLHNRNSFRLTPGSVLRMNGLPSPDIFLETAGHAGTLCLNYIRDMASGDALRLSGYKMVIIV